MNYRNKYVPSLSRCIHQDDYYELDLIDIFEMDAVEKFTDSPLTYLKETKIVNFNIIHEELKMNQEKLSFEVIYRELKKIKKIAKKIDISDYDNYTDTEKLQGYKGTLLWDKQNYGRKLDDSTREKMFEVIH